MLAVLSSYKTTSLEIRCQKVTPGVLTGLDQSGVESSFPYQFGLVQPAQRVQRIFVSGVQLTNHSELIPPQGHDIISIPARCPNQVPKQHLNELLLVILGPRYYCYLVLSIFVKLIDHAMMMLHIYIYYSQGPIGG